jgi:hypothetical protein
MRTIIAGSRSISSLAIVEQAMDQALILCGIVPSMVISGTARGADQLGEQWAAGRGIEVEKYPADWDRYGKSAGYIRNKEMADNADALVAIWDGESKGTSHMIDLAEAAGLAIYVYKINCGD